MIFSATGLPSPVQRLPWEALRSSLAGLPEPVLQRSPDTMPPLLRQTGALSTRDNFKWLDPSAYERQR